MNDILQNIFVFTAVIGAVLFLIKKFLRKKSKAQKTCGKHECGCH